MYAKDRSLVSNITLYAGIISEPIMIVKSNTTSAFDIQI